MHAISQPTQLLTAPAAAGERVSTVDAAAGQPMTATALPADVLDHIARQLGFRGWAALKYFWLLERAVFVPDDAPTINAALNAAAHDGVVLVRPGLYGESVRVTRDLTLSGLGPRGSVVVQPPGWEAGLVWGGYSVGQATPRSKSASKHVRRVGRPRRLGKWVSQRVGKQASLGGAWEPHSACSPSPALTYCRRRSGAPCTRPRVRARMRACGT